MKDSFKLFDWKAATVVFGILSCALLYWLGNYFVTQREYLKDKQTNSEMFALKMEAVAYKMDRIQNDTTETKQLVKEVIQEQRKAK